MLERQRKETIIRLLELHRFTSIHDVVEATGASESTIRRDFIELEEENRLMRVRGGVQLVHEPVSSQQFENSFDRRTSINLEKKRRIAARACGFLTNGETIFIDGGTTTFQMVEYLASFSLQVVTNSFAIARHLITHSQCTVILPEGHVHPDSQLILSHVNDDPFQNYSASKAFMGIEGITEKVLTNNETLVIQAERAMIRHTHELIVLADESKFGKVGSLSLAPVESASKIVTTRDVDPEIVERIEAHGVEVIRV
jgi:DeoR family ulaG and ulaABCDEF operon transcriptional repressor